MNATESFIQKHRFDDVKKLAFAPCPPDVDLSFALSQIAGRQAVKNKIPSWYEIDNIIYPKHLSLEQCSSEATAKYKASLVKGDSLVDLTGGFGIDCAFLSQQFKSGVYVEQSDELCEIARNNFKTLGFNHIQIVHGNSIDYLKTVQKVDCIYIDPARRDSSGGKIVAIQDCEPDIIELKEQLPNKAGTVMIKLSPMLDISSALQSLSETSEIYVISVDGECKELLFILNSGFLASLGMTLSPFGGGRGRRHWLGRLLCNSERSEETHINCINILKNGTIQHFSFFKQEEQCTVNYTSEVKNFVYEPNASVLKAGAYKSVAFRFGLEKLHPDSHLYTSDKLIEDFPGRIFKLVSVSSFNKKEIRENLKSIEQANLSIRNFPCSVDELRKKLKLKDGGNTYLFATTLSDERKVLLTLLRHS